MDTRDRILPVSFLSPTINVPVSFFPVRFFGHHIFYNFLIKKQEEPEEAKGDPQEEDPKIEDIVKGKTIVLLDDIYDSGATLKEVGKLLTQKGAKYIVPIVIAKTVGGTL